MLLDQNGLPGGYSVAVDAHGVEVVLPSGFSLAAARKINEEGLQHDGIARIEADGAVVFTEKAVSVYRDLMGYECARLPLSEREQWGQELQRCSEQARQPRGLIREKRRKLDVVHCSSITDRLTKAVEGLTGNENHIKVGGCCGKESCPQKRSRTVAKKDIVKGGRIFVILGCLLDRKTSIGVKRVPKESDQTVEAEVQ